MLNKRYLWYASTPIEAEGLRARIITAIPEVKTVLFIGAGASAPFGYLTTDHFISEVKNLALNESEKEILECYTEIPDITIEDITKALATV